MAGIIKWWNSFPWVQTWPPNFSWPSTTTQAASVKHSEDLRWSPFLIYRLAPSNLPWRASVKTKLQISLWNRLHLSSGTPKTSLQESSRCFYHPHPQQIHHSVMFMSIQAATVPCYVPTPGLPSRDVIMFSGHFFLQLPSLLTPEWLWSHFSWTVFFLSAIDNCLVSLKTHLLC